MTTAREIQTAREAGYNAGRRAGYDEGRRESREVRSFTDADEIARRLGAEFRWTVEEVARVRDELEQARSACAICTANVATVCPPCADKWEDRVCMGPEDAR